MNQKDNGANSFMSKISGPIKTTKTYLLFTHQLLLPTAYLGKAEPVRSTGRSPVQSAYRWHCFGQSDESPGHS